MAWPPAVFTREAWANADAIGTVQCDEFTGAEGLRRLEGPQVVSASPAAAFRARLIRVQLAGCALERYTATGHRIDRTEAQIAAYPIPLVTLVAVLRGLVHVRTDQHVFDVPAGHAALLDSRMPISCRVPGQVELIRCVSQVEALPLLADQTRDPLSSAVPPSLLSSSTTRIMIRALDAAESESSAGSDVLARALLHLHAAVVDEVLEAASGDE